MLKEKTTGVLVKEKKKGWKIAKSKAQSQ